VAVLVGEFRETLRLVHRKLRRGDPAVGWDPFAAERATASRTVERAGGLESKRRGIAGHTHHDVGREKRLEDPVGADHRGHRWRREVLERQLDAGPRQRQSIAGADRTADPRQRRDEGRLGGHHGLGAGHRGHLGQLESRPAAIDHDLAAIVVAGGSSADRRAANAEGDRRFLHQWEGDTVDGAARELPRPGDVHGTRRLRAAADDQDHGRHRRERPVADHGRQMALDMVG
jgi:hypothetical protein